MKQKNQPAPPSLANAVDVICIQASQLSNLANTLANGYSDYPSIQGKILSESAGLDSAQKNLSSTCQSLSGNAGSNELAKSWERLSSSCRSIANAIIALLEILFRVEVERIYATNEKLQTAVNSAVSFPAAQIEANQQKFADLASDSASYANHLAQFLNMRAQSEESPSHKAELQQAAQTLLQSAQEIVNKANDCMDEPSDTQRVQDFGQLNRNAGATANEIIERIRDVEAQRNFARVPSAEMPQAPTTERVDPMQMEAPASPTPQKVTQVNTPPPQKSQPAQQTRNPAPVRESGGSRGQYKPAQNRPSQQRAGAPARRQAPQAKATDMNQIVDMAKDLANNNQVRWITKKSSERLTRNRERN